MMILIFFIIACFAAHPKHQIKAASTIDDVLKYFDEAVEGSNMCRSMSVFGEYTYTFQLKTGVTKYLFEDISIKENIAPLGNYNRPGDVYAKYYVCVHDTGDVSVSAARWSEVVYNQGGDGWTYEASFQYVIDNDDIYHNIPDNECAYHAGDNIRPYQEINTGITGTNEDPAITIIDGYFAIDGVNTWIAAPTDGTYITTDLINDCGIRVVLRDGTYYIGKTWFSSGYELVVNYGGNTNSIGIESCLMDGSDVYYTWQRLAKLVAKLLDENNLCVADVQPHHFFDGKHCPMTMREASMWHHFLNLVEAEYTLLQYKQQGFSFSFKSGNTEYVSNSGRVIKAPSAATDVSYTITVTKDGQSKSKTYKTTIQPQTSV